MRGMADSVDHDDGLGRFGLNSRAPVFDGVLLANNVRTVQQKLKDSLSGGLNITSAMDGAVDSLVELVRCTANATPS